MGTTALNDQSHEPKTNTVLPLPPAHFYVFNYITDVIYVISFRFQPAERETELQAVLLFGWLRKPAHPSCVVCLAELCSPGSDDIC